MNIAFTVIFGVLISVTTVFELIGVASKRRGDTITENWTWISDHLPRQAKLAFRMGTLAFFTWAIVHFASQP